MATDWTKFTYAPTESNDTNEPAKKKTDWSKFTYGPEGAEPVLETPEAPPEKPGVFSRATDNLKAAIVDPVVSVNKKILNAADDATGALFGAADRLKQTFDVKSAESDLQEAESDTVKAAALDIFKQSYTKGESLADSKLKWDSALEKAKTKTAQDALISTRKKTLADERGELTSSKQPHATVSDIAKSVARSVVSEPGKAQDLFVSSGQDIVNEALRPEQRLADKLINKPENKPVFGNFNTDSLEQSAGLSAGSIGASIAGRAVGGVAGAAAGSGVPVVGNVAGAVIGQEAGGLAASGLYTYKRSQYDTSVQLLRAANEAMKQKNGRQLTDDEANNLLAKHAGDINESAAWEAGPEAISNIPELAGLGKIFKSGKAVTRAGMIKNVLKGYGLTLAGELPTETVTEVMQSPAQNRMGLTDRVYDPSKSTEWGDALSNVAAGTIFQTGIQSGVVGTAGAAKRIYNKATGRMEPAQETPPTVNENSPTNTPEPTAKSNDMTAPDESPYVDDHTGDPAEMVQESVGQSAQASTTPAAQQATYETQQRIDAIQQQTDALTAAKARATPDQMAAIDEQLMMLDAEKDSWVAQHAHDTSPQIADNPTINTPDSASTVALNDANSVSTPAPELSTLTAQDKVKAASWVIRNKESGEVIAETFDSKMVTALNTDKYEAVPIQQHLSALNKQIAAENAAVQSLPEVQAIDEKITKAKVNKATRTDPVQASIQREIDKLEAEKTQIITTAKAKVAKPKVSKPAHTKTALQLIAEKGGIDPSDPLANDLRGSIGAEPNKNVRISGIKHLFAKQGGGMSIDRAAEMLYESGHIPEYDSIAFLNALHDSIAGDLAHPSALPQEPDINLNGVQDDIEENIQTVADVDYTLDEVAAILSQQSQDAANDALQAYQEENHGEPTQNERERSQAESFGAEDSESSTGTTRAGLAAPARQAQGVEQGNTEGLTLSGQTEAEAQATKTANEKAQADAAKVKAAEEAKIKADAELGGFRLTGSNRPADVAEAAGQKNLFDQPVEAKELTPAPLVFDSASPATVEDYDKLFTRLNGDDAVSANEVRALFERLAANQEATKQSLQKMTKNELERIARPNFRGEKKDQLVDAAYRNMLSDFAWIGHKDVFMTFSGFKFDERVQQVRDKLAKITDTDVAEYQQSKREAREEKKERVAKAKDAIANPKTLEDYQLKARVEKGTSQFTPEQRRKYEDLQAEAGIAKRQTEAEKKAAERTNVNAADVKSAAEIVETKHTKTGEPLFVVKAADRVEKDVYSQWLATAKKLGGWYSSFRGNGAVPGFQFKAREGAEAFQKYLSEGDTSAVAATVADKIEHRTEEKGAAAVLKLREMADKLEEAANAKLNADRKTNTHKRATQASHAEADARKDIQLAKTMQNIANAIESGEATHLSLLTQKAQVETLSDFVNMAKHKEMDALYPSYADREKHKVEPATVGTVDHAAYPEYTVHKEHVAEVVRDIKKLKGTAQLAAKLEKTAQYLRDSSSNMLPIDADVAEAIIAKHKAQNSKLSRLDQINLPWHWDDVKARRSRLERMGIESDVSLRAALREFIQYRSDAPKADPIKALERKLIGQRVGVDFFPTPKAVAERMVDEAGITEGMSVLEPSAGNGNIADAIKATGVTPDVVELSSQLRELLEAKGYPVVAHDFMDYSGKQYDRIVMNPPFGGGADIEHVRHAYSLLKPGGRVVAIMGEGAFFRSDKKATEFRAWLEEQGGTEEKLPEGTFNDAQLMATTGANARLVTLDKPGEESGNPDIRYSEARQNWYYSPLEKAMESTPDRIFSTGAQLKAYLAGNAAKLGIKQDEIQWSGINEWLDLQGQNKISKQAVLDYLKSGGVKVEEVMLGEENSELPVGWTVEQDRDGYWLVRNAKGVPVTPPQLTKDTAISVMPKTPFPTKYEQYTLPGGENYREVLLTLPSKDWSKQDINDRLAQIRGQLANPYLPPSMKQKFKDEQKELEAKINTAPSEYKSSHWDQQNVLAHVRFNERTDVDGKKVLFIEELQSDWGQEGNKAGFKGKSAEDAKRFFDISDDAWANIYDEDKEAYRQEMLEYKGRDAIPSAPFVTNTKAWLALGIKRMIAYAADNGFDKIAFINGEQSADRYDLSKSINMVKVFKDGELYQVFAEDKSGSQHDFGKKSANELPEVVGKDLAEKIVGDSAYMDGGGSKIYRGLDLKVGGEGMKSFYDTIVPQVAKDVLKKLGGGQIEGIHIASNGKSKDDLAASVYGRGETYRNLPSEQKRKIDAMHQKDMSNQTGFTITDTMREKAAAGLPLFSKATDSGQKADNDNNAGDFDATEVVKQAVGDELAQLIVIVKNKDEAEQHTGNQGQKLRSARGKVEGFYNPTTGKVVLIEDAFTSPKRMAWVAWHELYHRGASVKYGKELKKTLNVLANNHPVVRKLASALAKERGISNHFEALEEAIVELGAAVETGNYAEIKTRYGVTVPLSMRSGLAKALGNALDMLRKLFSMLTGTSFTSNAQLREFLHGIREAMSSEVAIGGNADNRMSPAQQDLNTGINGGDVKLSIASPAIAAAKSKLNTLLSKETKDNILYEIQDKYIDLKRVRERIADLGGVVSDFADAYLSEELFHGRAAKRIKDFTEKEIKPLLAELRVSGLTMDDLETYLHARHAPERNATMAERNPTENELKARIAKVEKELKEANNNILVYGQRDIKAIELELAALKRAKPYENPLTNNDNTALSGMSNAEAKSIMNGLSPANKAKLESLASRVDMMTEGTRSLYAEYGLKSQNEVDMMRKQWKHYVPTYRDEDHPDKWQHSMGSGFSVRDPANKRATGSNAKVTEILGHIMMQREQAITSGEKNRVAVALYAMAKTNPLKDFWKTDAPPVKDYIDPVTNIVSQGIDPSYRAHPNVVLARVNGREVAVMFDKHNEQAMRLAGAMKGLDASDLGGLTENVAKITRYMASINTQYNPVFGAMNLTRDFQEAAINLSSTPISDKRKQVMEDTWPALAAIYKHERGHKANAKWADLWNELQDEGGTTGYRDMYANAKERKEDLLKELGAMDRGLTMKGAHAVLDWLSDYNESMENAVRLSAYKAARDKGLSKKQAASIAKNLTVNFNRKGATTRTAGAWLAFFNASIQGTARMAATMLTKDGRLSKAGKVIIVGGMSVGALTTMYTMMMMGAGTDDDEYEKIPEFVKERALIIAISHRDYIAIPYPLGYLVWPNFGRKIMEAMVDNKYRNVSQASGMLMTAIGSFNPIGSSTPLQMLSPTVLDPLVAIGENKDWSGKSIQNEDFNKNDPTPGMSRARDSATPWAKGIATGANYVTGGDEYAPGAWSPTPEVIDFMINQVTGGVGRELGKAASTVSAPFTGEDLPANKLPLIGRIYGNTRGLSADSEPFYENLKMAKEMENIARGRIADGKPLQDDFNRDFLRTFKSSEKMLKLLRKQRDNLRENDGDVEKIRAINKRMSEIMSNANREANMEKANGR